MNFILLQYFDPFKRLFPIFIIIFSFSVQTEEYPPLFSEVEQNSPEILHLFDEKNSQIIDNHSNEKILKELKSQLIIDNQNDEMLREFNTSIHSFTKKWVYKYDITTTNPVGIYRRVERSLYQKFSDQNKLDAISWSIVFDMDQFTATHPLPDSFTQPFVSTKDWICLKKEETREFKRCLISISQDGSDHKIYYEFDFTNLAWKKNNPFKAEFFGKTTLSWIDENQLLVYFDNLGDYNHRHPNNTMDRKEAIANGSKRG